MKKRLLNNAMFIALILVFLVVAVGVRPADSKCTWNGKDLKCDAYWFFGMATSCIGLKNVSGYDVQFCVRTSGEPCQLRTLKKGATRSADYTKDFKIVGCSKKVSSNELPLRMERIGCYDAFDRKKNKDTGGGCGCKYFSCLPEYPDP